MARARQRNAARRRSADIAQKHNILAAKSFTFKQPIALMRAYPLCLSFSVWHIGFQAMVRAQQGNVVRRRFADVAPEHTILIAKVFAFTQLVRFYPMKWTQPGVQSYRARPKSTPDCNSSQPTGSRQEQPQSARHVRCLVECLLDRDPR